MAPTLDVLVLFDLRICEQWIHWHIPDCERDIPLIVDLPTTALSEIVWKRSADEYRNC